MMIAYSREELVPYAERAVEVSREAGMQALLVDEFLKDAIEVDVDCVCDGKRAVIGGHEERCGCRARSP